MGRAFWVRLFLWADEMSRSLGVLTLDLIARTGGFEQGMDRASRRVRSTADEMEAARRTADRYVMAIGAAGVAFASAAVAMAANAAKSMDATAKMAQQIGTTTEALSGMRFAAQQFANISDQQFDQAMRRMTRRIAEAAEGSGAAKNALDAMGLSARELARLSPDKQMLAIADAMQRTERQADRLRYTMAIFDTEGMALVPALQQGAEAFEQNIELARRFGVVVSTEAAQAAEQFNSNMALLTARQEGFKNQLAEAVLPMLADLSGRLVEIAQRIGPMGDAIEKALKAAGAAAAATAAIFVSRLIGSITSSVAAWTAATAEAARYQMTLARMAASAAGASTAVTAMTGAAAGGMAVMGRAAQLALGVLGGPAGLLVTAGLTAAAFLTMGRDARTAAVDIDELSESFKTLSAQKLELRMFDLEDEVKRLEDQARESGEILRTMEADVAALFEDAAKGVNITTQELENARRSLLEQRDAHETNNAELERARTLLNQVIDHLERLKGAAHGAAGGVEALNQAMHSEAGEKYLAQLQGQIKALQDGGDPIKMATRWISEHADATDADKAAIMSAAHALKALQDARNQASRSTSAATKALTEAQRAAQNFRREQERSLAAQYREISNLNDRAAALEDQVRYYGLSESALNDLTIARLEEQKAALMGIEGAEEEIAIRERMIEQYKRIGVAMRSLEQKEAERQAWEAWARDVETIFDQVGQSLTDAIFEGGKSGRDLLKDLFKTLTFRVLIQPVMGAMQGWVTNQLGGLFGYQNPQQQQQAGGGFGFSGGTFGAGGVEMAGDWLLRSGLAPETGAKMLMNADKIAKVGGSILSYGSAIYDLSQGKYGSAAGTAIGQALGGPPGAMIGNFVGGLVDGLFDREPTTRREQRTQVEYAGGIFDITKTDDRAPAGADAAARALAEQAVQTANEIFKQVGVDAAIDSFHAIMASSYKGDRDGVASGGTLRIGDELRQFGIANEGNPTIQGFGGWSDAPTLPRLATDIQLSVLEAFQAVSDELPSVLATMLANVDVRSLGEAEAQALAERFASITQGAAAFLSTLETTPFAELRDLSFDAAAAMVQFAGGIDNLLASQQTYYERFYSEQEQFEHSVELIGKALSEVGLEMPALTGSTEDMLASYRALVESLDLNTEAGQQAYVTLMQTAGAFADVAQFAGQAAVESQRLADQQRQAMQALRQSFVGLAGDALAAIQQHGQERIAKLSESFARTDAVFNAYRSQVQQLESQWGSLITTMQRSMRDLRGQVEASARLQYDQARAVISTALLTSKLPQTADLGEAIRVAQQGVTGGRYASEFDQREAYLKLANELEALQGIAQPELDTARASLAQLEKQYNRLRGIEDLSGLSLKQLEKQFAVALSAEAAARTQIEQIERQIAMAQLQYQQLVGINDELSTLPGALKALAKAIDAASRVPAESTAVNREARYLANNPDVLAAYVRGDWGVQTAEEAARYHWEKYGKYEGRQFARGGYYPGGLALVGEEGPELINFARPGQVYRADQTQDILRQLNRPQGDNTAALERRIDELIRVIEYQSQHIREINKSSKRTANHTETMERSAMETEGLAVVAYG